MTEARETSTSGNVLLSYAWGTRLREAREAQGLTLEAVVSELHLELTMLRALEQEDLTRLPSSSFVKGYLRSYARLLALPSDDIVAAYDAIKGDESPCLKKTMGVKQLSSQDKMPRIVTWVVVAVLALSIIWWWSSIILSKGNDSLKSASFAQQPSVQADVLVDGESITVAPLMLPDDGETIERSATLTNNINTELASDLPETVVEPLPPVQSVVPEPVVAASARVAPDYSGQPLSTLSLSFEQDSWVEIADVTGKRLFFDLGREGQTRELRGIAPFKVLFGNAPGVRLSIDGEPFDHVPYQRNGGVALFTLRQ